MDPFTAFVLLTMGLLSYDHNVKQDRVIMEQRELLYAQTDYMFQMVDIIEDLEYKVLANDIMTKEELDQLDQTLLRLAGSHAALSARNKVDDEDLKHTVDFMQQKIDYLEERLRLLDDPRIVEE